MYRIVGGRAVGKTYRLLEQANKVSGIVVCSNPNAMREKAYNWGFSDIFDFISYEESINYYTERSIFLDEIEKYAMRLLNRHRFSGYTYTLEDNNEG